MEFPPGAAVSNPHAPGTSGPRLPRFGSVALKFVIQDRKAINRGRLDAQNQLAERNRLRAGILNRLQFFRLKSPSGPIQTPALCGQRPCFVSNSRKTSRGWRRSFCNEPTSERSNFSLRARNCSIVTGASIFGSHAAPHCLMASIATCCHLSRLFSASSSSSCVTTRSDSNRHNSPRAQFDGFLDDALDDFSLGHGLSSVM